jgi:phosphoglycerate dehydrogenase-like enzyme
MKTLLLTHPLPTREFAAAIRAIAPNIELLDNLPPSGHDDWSDVEAVLGWRFPARALERLPRLRWVCSIGAGVEKLLVGDLPESVQVSRIVDLEQDRAIAQYVAMMALRHARGLARYEAQQRTRAWDRHPVGVLQCRVGVLGMGAVGTAVAELLGQIGFQVQGFSRGGTRSLQEVMASSDIVVCALPLTDSTTGILDRDTMGHMPRGSYLINIARGAHVIEPDLIEAVQSGHLAGAALDVQQREPMPADDPLWSVEGISITPHIAGQSSPQAIAAQFVEGWQRVRRGESPLNLVDRARGY